MRMLILYLLLLAALAAFTAHTRSFQRTVVMLDEAVGSAAGVAITPRAQGLATAMVLVLWPLALGLGLLFVAWWKAVALVVGAFVLLVPVLGSLTPRPMSEPHLRRIRADLARRIADGGPEAPHLRAVLERLDGLSPADGG